MAKVFDIAALAAEEQITVKLRDGGVLHGRELTPDVVDTLGVIESKRTREMIKRQAERRAHIQVREDDNAATDAFVQAGEALIDLTDADLKAGRQIPYDQLSAVLVDADGKKVTVPVLQQQIPLPVAQRICDELTRQILGREDAEGNAEGSEPDPTPTGSTS